MIDAKHTAPELRINNRVVGTLEHNSHPVSELSEAQTAILLRSLLRKSNIDFLADGIRWHLSDKGAAAVLLKMDEFQGRIGTPGAIVRKGKKSEDTVYPQEQIPSITQAPFKKALPGDDQFFRMNQEALLAAIRDSVPTRNYECSGLLFDDKGKLNSSGHEVVRLTGTKMLFSCICRRDANNEYYGYWVVNDSAPYEPALVTITGQYSRNKATLRSHYEGDCSGVNEWTWDGNRFVLTNAVAWKICRKIDGEDAWRLPTVITNVF